MILSVLLILLAIIASFFVDPQTMTFMLAIYLIGFLVIRLLNSKERKDLYKIYNILFFAGAAYMLACYVYMIYHNYEYLLVFDSYNAFIPKTQEYLEYASYFKALKEVWSEYNFFDRFQPGYFTYALFFAFIGKPFNLNILVEQQITVVLLYSFVGVMLFKLFRRFSFNQRKSYKYTIIISLISVVFYYSFFVLRDIHVMLLYLLAIYYSSNPQFSFYNVIKIGIVMLVTMTFRVESGVFLIVLIPVYLLLSLQNKRQRVYVIISSLVLLVALSFFVTIYYDSISSVFEANQEHYVEGVSEGGGMIARFQKVPVIGDFASIMYNASQPIPSWAGFLIPKKELIYGKEIYNIMKFPRVYNSFFNWFVIIYVFFWLTSSKIRTKVKGSIPKPLQYQLWFGLIFLYMQSAVIAQRRLLAYYCVFYIFFFIIYNSISARDKKQITITAIFSFIALQVVGVIYLM